MAEDERTPPVDVRVTELPEAFTILLQSLVERLNGFEARETRMHQKIAMLEAQIGALGGGGAGGGPFGAGGPVHAPEHRDEDTQMVDAGEFAQALGEQILAGSDENSDFMIDNVTIEAVGGLGQKGTRAQIATNARQQAVSQNASKITFSVRRRKSMKIVE
ncbi:MAG: hypothetical protein NWQ23_13690 [Yoonia sp.]|uniref:hypothetical protein n=1 Tax=Yoonia sp. TaxID=2212373 RepID=UPI00273FCAC3|nr:hypothetical protein [Yoonia sp.]MDP5086468.1 hypothetical protein [Yoonia sp.]MDP5361687.1 hypothetical protein [Paracoccaceae bacterium]